MKPTFDISQFLVPALVEDNYKFKYRCEVNEEEYYIISTLNEIAFKSVLNRLIALENKKSSFFDNLIILDCLEYSNFEALESKNTYKFDYLLKNFI